MPNPATATPTRLHRRAPTDEAQRLADVAERLRAAAARAQRRSLPPEDLEDVFGQAVLELLLRASRGARFASDRHVANALSHKVDSRIADRQRANAGRSIAARARLRAVPIDDVAFRLHAGDDSTRTVIAREQLRELTRAISTLPAQQRRALVCEIAGLEPAAARAVGGFSADNYRLCRSSA